RLRCAPRDTEEVRERAPRSPSAVPPRGRVGRVGPRWPESDHDLDFMLKPEDADEGLAALVEAGLRPERPPEAWLYKAWDSNGVMVDLIFAPLGPPSTDEVFQRSGRIEVEAVAMQVIALEDLFATKLLALDEQGLDYKS